MRFRKRAELTSVRGEHDCQLDARTHLFTNRPHPCRDKLDEEYQVCFQSFELRCREIVVAGMFKNSLCMSESQLETNAVQLVHRRWMSFKDL